MFQAASAGRAFSLAGRRRDETRWVGAGGDRVQDATGPAAAMPAGMAAASPTNLRREKRLPVLLTRTILAQDDCSRAEIRGDGAECCRDAAATPLAPERAAGRWPRAADPGPGRLPPCSRLRRFAQIPLRHVSGL